MRYKTVLVAIDNSDEAELVVQAALDATDTDADIHLVSVVEPLASIYGSMIWSPVLSDTHSVEQSLIKQSKARLLETCVSHDIAPENGHVFFGAAAPQIRDAAARLKADLIVIGTHGRHGVALILGSTANSVLHGINTDVLVIRL